MFRLKSPTRILAVLLPLLVIVWPESLWAGPDNDHLDGGSISAAWALPFACMLLSVALGPLIAPKFWHHHYGKVAAFWAAVFLVSFALLVSLKVAFYSVCNTE